MTHRLEANNYRPLYENYEPLDSRLRAELSCYRRIFDSYHFYLPEEDAVAKVDEATLQEELDTTTLYDFLHENVTAKDYGALKEKTFKVLDNLWRPLRDFDASPLPRVSVAAYK